MRLRAILLLRITVTWAGGLAFAITPQVVPWISDGFLPSAEVIDMGVKVAMPLLLAGALCCLSWPASVARFPLWWVGGTIATSCVYLYLLGFELTFGALSLWIGAVVSGALFYAWAVARPLTAVGVDPSLARTGLPSA